MQNSNGMYNEYIKRKFINEYTQNPKTVINVTNFFEQISAWEKTYERDLCELTPEELQPVVDNVLGIRTSSKWMYISMLRKYFRWCAENGVTGATDSIRHVKFEGLEKVRTRLVSGPLHLQSYLDALFDPESEKTVHNVYRGYLWLGFSGVPEERVETLTANHIDFRNMVIKNEDGGEDYPMYRCALPTFYNLVELKQFYYKHKQKDGAEYECWRDRFDSDLLFRGIKSNPQMPMLRNKIAIAARNAANEGKTNLRISYGRAAISGEYHVMYDHERAGKAFDITGFALKNIPPEELVCGLTFNQKRHVNEYKNDYERWKLAFFG